MTAKAKVPVSERALIQRINRKLAKDDEVLRTARYVSDGRGGARENPDVGRHYIVNVNRNYLESSDIDIESLGRELGVLRPWEQLASE